jgi:hypothetical protein
MRCGLYEEVLPVCGSPARIDSGGAVRFWSITGKCEEKPMAGSPHPLPNADMRVKRLCKGKVPLSLCFFFRTV